MKKEKHPRQTLRHIVEGLRKKIGPEDLVDPIFVTLSLLKDGSCYTIKIPGARLAGFLRAVGRQTVDAGLHDVQFWLQKRRTKARDGAEELDGIVIDVDEKLADVTETLTRQGMPLPNVLFDTKRGHRLCYVFDRPATDREWSTMAAHLVLGIPGADVASVHPSEAQRLPHVLRETDRGIEEVKFEPKKTNPVPLSLSTWQPKLPPSLPRQMGLGRTLSPEERAIVEDYLTNLGIPAPSSPGRNLYNRCPHKAAHRSSATYVNRNEDGSIYVHCLAQHDGLGEMGWHETRLLELATGEQREGIFADPVADIPVTWAGVETVRALAGRALEAPAKQKLAVDLWMAARSHHDARKLLKTDSNDAVKRAAEAFIDRCYETRLNGYDEAGGVRLFYDVDLKELCLIEPDGRIIVTGGGITFPLKRHQHEWFSTTALTLKPIKAKQSEVLDGSEGDADDGDGDGDDGDVANEGGAPERDDRQVRTEAVGGSPAYALTTSNAESDFDKARKGYRLLMKKLGIARIKHHDFPLAFQDDSWDLDGATGCILGVRVPTVSADAADFDVVAFFEELRSSGHLPFATADDVKRFVMLLATPLLREVAPGLLGIYWLVGPPGAGKDFFAVVADRVWRAVSPSSAAASIELGITDDLEQKRMMAAAGSSLFVRAKEAGKRPGMVDLLIRLAGTDSVPTRDVYKSQGQAQNTYTLLADSAEEVADRREIHRRTVIINVARIPDEESKGQALREIVHAAPEIIAALKAKVESKTPEWFLDQKDTDTRPVVPVALSRLFKVELPTVKGGSLEDLFDTMLDYAKSHADDEGERQRAKARSADGQAANAFKSYRLSHFISTMRRERGYEAIMDGYARPDDIINAIRRETDYDPSDRQNPQLNVEVRGFRYTFRLVMSRRNFVLVQQLRYYNTLGIPLPREDDGPDDDLPFDAAAADSTKTTAAAPTGADAPTSSGEDASGDEADSSAQEPKLKVVSS